MESVIKTLERKLSKFENMHLELNNINDTIVEKYNELQGLVDVRTKDLNISNPRIKNRGVYNG